ncbi:MAG: PDZ domain-containing protein [Planctomycetales bacterium]|nr:PDZ domain-containing protein [Planctomycetales bacterium]
MKQTFTLDWRRAPALLLGLFFVAGFHTAIPVDSLAQPPAVEPAEETEDQENPDDSSGIERFWRQLGNRRNVYQRSHDEIRSSFNSVTKAARASTVRVLVNGAQASFGTIVDASGLILTKGSELRDSDDLMCELYDNRRIAAVQVGSNDEYDFALLKIAAEQLPVAPWVDHDIAVGAWLVTPGLKDTPISIGVVSTAPRRILRSRALIGIRLGPNPKDPNGGALVVTVFPGGGADRAGVKPDDVVLGVDDRDIATADDLISYVSGLLPGDRVKLKVKRGDEELSLTAELREEQAFFQSRVQTQNSLGGPISRRRSGFPRVIQHDSVLRPEECGGPLVNLDGKVVGINIARAGRVASYAIPTREVLNVLPTLVEKMDNYRLHLTNQKVAELERRAEKFKSVLKTFEDRLKEAEQDRDKTDPDKKDELEEKRARVRVLQVRVKESKDRVAAIESELQQLKEQHVKQEAEPQP